MFALVMFAFIALVFSVGRICSHSTSEEPMCNSRFDFESKLLERTVLVEHRMNLVEQSTKKELEDLRIEKTELQKKVAELERNLKEEQKTKLSEIETISEEFTRNANKNMNNKINELEKISEEFTSNVTKIMNNKINELETISEEFARIVTKNMNNKINELEKISEELKSNVSIELDKIEQNSNVLENNHIQYMYDIKSSQSDFETKINASITEIQDTISKPISAVAFYFRDPHTKSPYQNTLIRFTTKITNTDAVYDPDTGYFTSPAAGLYLFVVQICGYKSSIINFRIYVNDVYVSDTSEYDNDSNDHCTSTSAVTILKQGDKVSVKTGPNSTSGNTIISTSYKWSTVMGVLVQRL